ncbi:MAG: right-handed parallel beta-helix repeat-containing protein, partial [Gemmatimonadaceae bacterium]|nr:right-handed parallel beta-helix repeat-containing protein [Gemmatimonadaceae bacterium]
MQDSEVNDCIRWENIDSDDRITGPQETHCVHITHAQDVSIRDNRISLCHGDGVQLEPTSTTGPQWGNVEIIGNEFFTRHDPDVAAATARVDVNDVRPGENAVDAKSGIGYIYIRGNTVRGYRGWNSASAVRSNPTLFPPPVPLTGAGTGYPSDKGAGLLLHRTLFDWNCRGFCAEIDGNDISDTNVGISVGALSGVIVRRNVIHDLSADAEHELEPQRKGAAIQAPGSLGADITHNTIVNTPGLALYDSNDGTYTFRHNLIVNAGSGCTEKSMPRLISESNYCYNASDPRSGNPANICDGVTLPDPPIFIATNPDWAPVGCGMPPSTMPLDTETTDYALSALSTAVIEQQNTSTDSAPVCGNYREVGAKEHCQGPDIRLTDVGGWIDSAARDYYRLSSEFVIGVAAYANAMTFETGGLNAAAPINSTCSDAQGTDACLFYTGRCLSECGRSYTGEIDCSCLANKDLKFGMQPPLQSRVQAALHVDQDGDGMFESVRDQASFARATQTSELSYLLGWEDNDSARQGDRNDFMASVRAMA